MIYVDVRGNVGNQFFIYAFARALQKKTGQQICLNTYNLNKYFPNYKFSLDEFKLTEKVVVEKDKKLPFFLNTYSLPYRFLGRVGNLFPKIDRIVKKNVFNYLSKFGIFLWTQETFEFFKLEPHKNYYVSGFWQSELYFKEITNDLKKELVPKQSVQIHNEELYNLILSSNSICVTIRRGDYVKNKKIKKNYYLCDDNFFYSGVSLIRKKFPDALVVCFSDDIDWVKENLNFNCPTYYESGKDSVSEKIRLMSACKHFVISNSSFSWWASYLSKRSNGVTVAPSRWYTDNRQTDIYRKNWVLLEV